MATRNANLKEREESTEAEASGEEKRSWPKEREKEREKFLHRVEIGLEVEK